jgi:hypothetical protein
VAEALKESEPDHLVVPFCLATMLLPAKTTLSTSPSAKVTDTSAGVVQAPVLHFFTFSSPGVRNAIHRLLASVSLNVRPTEGEPLGFPQTTDNVPSAAPPLTVAQKSLAPGGVILPDEISRLLPRIEVQVPPPDSVDEPAKFPSARVNVSLTDAGTYPGCWFVPF